MLAGFNPVSFQSCACHSKGLVVGSRRSIITHFGLDKECKVGQPFVQRFVKGNMLADWKKCVVNTIVISIPLTYNYVAAER